MFNLIDITDKPPMALNGVIRNAGPPIGKLDIKSKEVQVYVKEVLPSQ